MLTENYITEVYCLIDDMLKKNEKSLRSRGPRPNLSDAEVITMEIVGESIGMDEDKAIHRYFRDHWHPLFPKLGTRTTFLRQAANLWKLKQLIREDLLNRLLPAGSQVCIADGFPIPVCNFRRANFCRLLRGCAAYGHCAAKAMLYYGLKGYLLIDQYGVILDCKVAPANIDEREMLLQQQRYAAPHVIGDKGSLCNGAMQEAFRMAGITLHTPLRANMKDPRPAVQVKALNNRRRLIETVIGQLTERFHIEKVRARDLWHLTVRIERKLLAHTVNCFLNYAAGNPILQFERIFS